MSLHQSSGRELQTLVTGLSFGESPRWHESRLWFSDWGTQEIIAVNLEGQRDVIAHVPAVPCCIDFLPDGRLLMVVGQQLLAMEPDGSLGTYADLTGLSSYAWNDVVVDGRGNTYVNNIGFDFPDGDFAPGSIAIVTPDGTRQLVASGLAFPNGMAVTPDNMTLIVAESYGKKLTAFTIHSDGSLSNQRIWADLGDGVPDGICLDATNAVWYGDVPNKRCVRVGEGGDILQTINLDRGCFACTLGGTNNRTLFMVATEWGDAVSTEDGARTGQVLSVEVTTPGAGWQ